MPHQVLGLIPARGGSKGIPHKNIVPLGGKPLIAWTIEAAQASHINRLILSSDDPAIIQTAQSLGVEVPFIRPIELTSDTTPGIDVVIHAVEWMMNQANFRPDAVMLLQPTSPLRRAEHIDAALDLFWERDADSLVSVVKVPHSMIPESLMQLDAEGWLKRVTVYDERRNLRQSKPTYWARNGAAIYLVKTDLLLERRTLYGDHMVAYEMSREDSIDIDDRFDLQMCEWILAARNAARNGE